MLENVNMHAAYITCVCVCVCVCVWGGGGGGGGIPILSYCHAVTDEVPPLLSTHNLYL